MVHCFSNSAMKANPAKFQAILLKANEHAETFTVLVQSTKIDFTESISALAVCMNKNLSVDLHVDNICLLCRSVSCNASPAYPFL